MIDKQGYKRKKSKTNEDGPPCFSMPLTERQQLAYLLSMTARESQGARKAADDSEEVIDSTKHIKKSRLSPTSRVNRSVNKNGETQLHLAATKGDVESVKRLLKLDADVNVKDNAREFSILWYFYWIGPTDFRGCCYKLTPVRPSIILAVCMVFFGLFSKKLCISVEHNRAHCLSQMLFLKKVLIPDYRR